MVLKKKKSIVLILLVTLIVGGCATYYKQTLQFQQFITKGQLEKAYNWIKNDNKGRNGKNKLLHYLNHGYVSWMLGNYEESNQKFHKADYIIEDYLKNYGLEALSLVSNPNVKPYKPEDFESVILHYFTSLNYLNMGEYDKALVECRRVNIRLQQLNDKYKDHKNRYQRDAFAHNLMGMIYEADKDYNNAFIAYRNAYEIYKKDYKEYFNMQVPEQLKYDILRTAYLTGFSDEVRYYEKQFGIDYSYVPKPAGEVILFWMNGFGPVKDEWSLRFTKYPSSRDGYVIMKNKELDISCPVYIGDKSENEKKAFENLRFFKVAFPKYLERKPIYSNATIYRDREKYDLEMAQDINEIAFKTLHDRMLREISNAILRIATKKALEALADKEDETIGTLVNIANTLTEKADTRHWQTLPYSISYARIPLQEGENTIRLEISGRSARKQAQEYTFEGKKGRLYFHAHHTTTTRPPRMN
ncbi:MAG: COG3014 family protein [Bacteroidota bacterium]